MSDINNNVIKNEIEKIHDEQLKVKINDYEGPFDLLYSLIKERRMDIMNINLVELIDQYVSFINKNFHLLTIDDLTEYLLMATYLLEQKSKKILPVMDTQEKIDKDIERDKFIQRLLVYKQYQDIIPNLVDRMEKRSRMFERTEEIEDKSVYFEKPEEIEYIPTMDLNNILKAMQKIYIKLQQKQAIRKNIDNIKTIEVDEVSIDDVENEIIEFLKPHPNLFRISFMEYFQSIDPKKFTKQYFAVSFVAILVLVRNQQIRLEQNNSDEEIFIVKIDKEVNPDEN